MHQTAWWVPELRKDVISAHIASTVWTIQCDELKIRTGDTEASRRDTQVHTAGAGGQGGIQEGQALLQDLNGAHVEQWVRPEVPRRACGVCTDQAPGEQGLGLQSGRGHAGEGGCTQP